MTVDFDLTPEELNIYLAESNEQLQLLEEGLVALERDDHSEDLVQSLFRAAHTLKGSAGMIGHHRKVEITNSLESALDGLRQKSIKITPELIDICLDSVDAIRMLVDEVRTGELSYVDTTHFVESFDLFLDSKKRGGSKKSKTKSASEKKAVKDITQKAPGKDMIKVEVGIDQNSIASSARALQILMAIHQLGEVVESSPEMQEIESGNPVEQVCAMLKKAKPVEEIKATFEKLSELTYLSINDEKYPLGEKEKARSTDAAKQPQQEEQDESSARFGDFLVKQNIISIDQLEAVIEQQKSMGADAPRIGKLLVENGTVSQTAIDDAIAMFVKELQNTTSRLKASPAKSTKSEKTIRTSVERLDVLVNLVGELITDRNRLYQIRSDMGMQSVDQAWTESFSQTITHLGRITNELQSEILSIRMLPISTVFNKFPRLVRDLSRKLNKKIDLVISGEDTEVDRTVLDKISDPLIHLLRNAADHGIESPADRLATGKSEIGTIHLSAKQENGQIVIVIKDDGQGIDADKVRASSVRKGLLTEQEATAMTDEQAVDMIFESGVSTRTEVSEVSGRGVGMDIVRTNIELLNGSISLYTQVGQGTECEIIMPLTFEIVPTLLTRSNSTTIAIPLSNIAEVLRVPVDEIKSVGGNSVINRRDETLRLFNLNEALGFGKRPSDSDVAHVISIRFGKTKIGLAVDQFVREEDLMVKSVGLIKDYTAGLAGASILGDGSVALILDVPGLIKAVA